MSVVQDLKQDLFVLAEPGEEPVCLSFLNGSK